ncbi:MAG: LysR family transcriptional regulator [Mycobacteriales bacterium]
MELRQMRYFIAVAEELHFGRAAGRLHISAPTLSQQIKQVEHEIGVPLLIRRHSGVALTPAGGILLEGSRIAVRAADEAVVSTRRSVGLEESALRLGLLNGAPGWIPMLIKELVATAAADAGGCRVDLIAGVTADQMRLVGAGQVDLGLVRAPISLPDGMRSVNVGSEELGVLMLPSHPLAAGEDADPVSLTGRELMWFPRQSAPEFYDDALGRLRRAGGDVTVSEVAISHAQLVSGLLVRREAITLGSSRAAGSSGVVWRRLRGAPLVVTFAAIWLMSNCNPVLRSLVPELLREPPPGLHR